MMPRWIFNKRNFVCAICAEGDTCSARANIDQPDPQCPLGKLPTEMQEVVARAWPVDGHAISGCCDSPLNYL